MTCSGYSSDRCSRIMFAVLKDGAPAYIFHADSEGENFRAAFQGSRVQVRPVLYLGEEHVS